MDSRPPAIAIGLLLMFFAALPTQAGPGDLDVRFGTHGQTVVPGQVDSTALIAMPDGRLVVFGLPENHAARGEGAIGVARLQANGEPDASFAPGGHLDLPLGSEPLPVPTDALLLADGRILVSGYFANGRIDGPGWLVRLSPGLTIDPTFGTNGVVRAGQGGIDRIALLFDGTIAIAAGALGMLHRLDPNGAPAWFPGSELSVVPLRDGYSVTAMQALQDGGLIWSSGVDNGWDSLYLFHVSASGRAISLMPPSQLHPDFDEVVDFASHRDGALLMACGHKHDALVIQRWHDGGSQDRTFAPATEWPSPAGRRRSPRLCHALLPLAHATLQQNLAGIRRGSHRHR